MNVRAFACLNRSYNSSKGRNGDGPGVSRWREIAHSLLSFSAWEVLHRDPRKSNICRSAESKSNHIPLSHTTYQYHSKKIKKVKYRYDTGKCTALIGEPRWHATGVGMSAGGKQPSPARDSRFKSCGGHGYLPATLWARTVRWSAIHSV